MGEGAAILLGGHFQNIDWYWGVIFRQGSITWGVILMNFATEVQSSNEHELKLTVTAVNGKTRFLKMASPLSQVTNDQPLGKESIKRVECNLCHWSG